MTLAELRRLSEGIQRLPCDDPEGASQDVLAFNASVSRFQELVVRVRNQLVVAGPWAEPQESREASQVRELASSLAARRASTQAPWLAEGAEETTSDRWNLER